MTLPFVKEQLMKKELILLNHFTTIKQQYAPSATWREVYTKLVIVHTNDCPRFFIVILFRKGYCFVFLRSSFFSLVVVLDKMKLLSLEIG